MHCSVAGENVVFVLCTKLISCALLFCSCSYCSFSFIYLGYVLLDLNDSHLALCNSGRLNVAQLTIYTLEMSNPISESFGKFPREFAFSLEFRKVL